MTMNVTIADAKARLSELVRRTELTHERIVITRRGKPVASIQPIRVEAPEDHWVTRAAGLFADYPEITDAIDEAYRARRGRMPRPVNFPEDDG